MINVTETGYKVTDSNEAADVLNQSFFDFDSGYQCII